ncbi:MAG: ferrochelatase, partial [Pseudanabaenales cyanobacterium]|nr:ferrochelatase [Pseudanabaenales cyanobacterium]
MGRIGVLLLNLGGPDKLKDVRPFLYNLFADPEIIRLPSPWLQAPLAWLISTLRAKKSQENYKKIGGSSPLRRITESQAQALQEQLRQDGHQINVYIGMRYWHPFTEEAIAQIKQDKVEELVILPLYPQFSISTSGSSFRLLERLWKADPELQKIK